MNKTTTLLTLLLLLLWGQGQAQTRLDISQGSITINDRGYEQNGTPFSVENNTYIITQTNNSQPTANNITITGGTINVTLQNVNIRLGNNPIWVQTGATLNLAVSGENKLKSTGGAGIRVTEGASLVIDGKITDKLHVVGGRDQTGIGENKSGKGGSVTIRGGYVVAEHTGSGGAGIGQPGWSGSFQAVTIEGGYVEATGHGDEGSIAANRVDITGGVVRLNDDKLKDIDNTNCLIIRNGKIDKDATLSGAYLIGGSALISVELGVTVTLQENSTLTLAEGGTLFNQGTITGDGTLVNNGTLYNGGSLTVDYSGDGTKMDNAGLEISGGGSYEETDKELKIQGGDLTIKGVSMTKYILVEKDTRLTIDGLLMDLSLFSMDKSPIEIAKGVQLTLVLKGESRLMAHKLMSAIHVPEGATLVVSEESTGSLIVKGGERAAGIGGYGVDGYGAVSVEKAGSILIYGGKITAKCNTGDDDDEVAVALGGGYGRVGVTYYGGQTNGSIGGSVEKIAIYGGEVIAPLGHIGGGNGRKSVLTGKGGDGGTVDCMIIAGGNIQAKSVGGGNGGGRLNDNRGTYGHGGNVTEFIISGGILTAEWIGAGSSPDIASDKQGKCDLTITGGSVKLTDAKPLRYAEPKDAAGNPLFLAITPEQEYYNSLSVDDRPYFIDSYHQGDKKFYLYLPDKALMAVRNRQGTITAYTVTKKSSVDSNGNWFDFATGAAVTPEKTLQVTGQSEITYGDTEVKVQWQEGGSSYKDYSVPMNVVSYQVLTTGSEVAYENRVALPDITQALSLPLSVLPAGAYTLKLRYGGDTRVWPSAEIELPLKIGRKTVAFADIQVTIQEQAITYDGQSHPATVTPAEGIEGLGTISVKYAKQQAADTWREIEGEPKDAGTYRFTVEIVEGNYNGASFTSDDWTFDIQKATPDANCFTYEKAVLQRGTTLEEIKEAIREKLKLKPELDGMGEITVTCFQGDEALVEVPAAGSYSFKITVAAGDNYMASLGELTHDAWLFDLTPVKEDDCFLIQTVDDLVWFRGVVNGGQFRLNARLTADIDLKDIASWEPIKNYGGTFDGNGYVIRNLTLNTNDYYGNLGLFGRLFEGEIKNLGLEGVKIKTNRDWGSGILVGTMNRGAITNCYVTNVSFEGEGNGNEWGIVSEVFSYSSSSSLTGCYTTLNRLINQYHYSPNVTNCYYLQSDESREQLGTPLSAEQFASGELVRLLQQGQTEKVWGKRLGDGGDPYPILLVSLTEEEKNAFSVYTVTYNDLPAETSEGPLTVYANGGAYTPVETAPKEKPGYAFMGWSATEGAATAEASFTVSADMTLYAVWSRFYTITQQEVVNGSIITVQESALSGDKVTIVCTPNNGYMFGNCTVTTDADPAEEVELTFDETSGTYAFTMPSGNVTVSVTFKEVTYAIAKEEVVNGSITVNESALFKAKVTIACTPAEGYTLGTCTVTTDADPAKEVELTFDETSGTYTFTMPACAVIISATFEKASYAIQTAEVKNGRIEVQESALFGDKVTITCTPANGYTLGACTVTTDADPAKEVELTFDETSGTYTFTMPAGNVTISATFKKATYAIQTAEVKNGSIEVKESALFEEEVSITCTPDNGYTFGNCTVIAADSEFSITLIPGDMPGTFTFIMPACDVTISAIFVEEQPGGGDDGDGDDGDGDDNDGDDNDGDGDDGDDGDGGDGDDGDGDGDDEDPDPVANTEVGHTEPTARVINGNLLLSVPETTEAVLFNFNGRALRRLQLPVGDTWINDLPVGPYIVRFDGKKVVKLVINR